MTQMSKGIVGHILDGLLAHRPSDQQLQVAEGGGLQLQDVNTSTLLFHKVQQVGY